MKFLLVAALFLTGASSFASVKYSPEIGPDSSRPKVALRFNRADGSVQVHTGGQWKNAQFFDKRMHDNKVELRDNPDSSWLFNFWYGDWYDYGYYYPRNYYYYTPTYGLWWGGNYYNANNWYDRGNYSYYSYYW